jgi:signal recognition particle receptor subunit beta
VLFDKPQKKELTAEIDNLAWVSPVSLANMALPTTRIVLAGHVDAGKSTLAGHLLYHLGVFSDRDLQAAAKAAEANHMSSWRYAYLLDILEEEQQSGKTRDYVEVPFTLGQRSFLLVDTPGHHHLIPAMIDGADRATAALVVLSCKSSEFDKCLNDTEHLVLLKCLGIKHVIAVLNKCDTVDAAVLAAHQTTARKMLRKVGFREPTFVSVSALNGTGFPELLAAVAACPAPEPAATDVTEDAASATTELTLAGIVLCPLLTAGYQGVLHGSGGLQVEAEVAALHHTAPFARRGTECRLTIRLPNPQVLQGTRYVLRDAGSGTVFVGRRTA